MTYDALDDFAGPGGWDQGAAMLGLRTVGIEYNHDVPPLLAAHIIAAATGLPAPGGGARVTYRRNAARITSDRVSPRSTATPTHVRAPQ